MSPAVRLGVAVAAVLLLGFGWLAARHGVNADEGFYVLAALRVAAGERVYAEFFYPQMPYLPWVAAPLLAWSGPSLLLPRLLSVVPGALLGGLLAAVAWRRTASLTAAIGVALLYGLHGLSLNYLTVTKTYGLANLAAVAGFLLLVGGQPTTWRALAAGLCLGFGVGVRLPLAPLLVLGALWSGWHERRLLLSFAAGALVALTPCVILLLRDFDVFWFNNLGFHAVRKEISGLGPILAQKVDVLSKWTLLPQNFVLWGLALGGCWKAPRLALPPLIVGMSLAAVYLYATPTYLEYLIQIVPFLLLAALPLWTVLRSRRVVLALVASVYAVGLLLSLRPVAQAPERQRKLQLWNLDRVEAVSHFLRSNSEPGDRILSWWEGYPWLANRDGYRGVGFWESNVGKKLPPADRGRYHVLGRDELRELIDSRDPRLIVVAEGVWPELRPTIEASYERRFRLGAVEVFGRRRDVEGM